MASTQYKGPLESINVRLEKDQGEQLKKAVGATKAIFDSIGSSASASADSKK